VPRAVARREAPTAFPVSVGTATPNTCVPLHKPGGASGVPPPSGTCQFRLTDPTCQSKLTGVDLEDPNLALSSDDPAVGLRASLALHRLAERVEAKHVAAAREQGWSWQQIGDALGVTRQSVHTKYNRESS
jgi:hypothetical protein